MSAQTKTDLEERGMQKNRFHLLVKILTVCLWCVRDGGFDLVSLMQGRRLPASREA